MSVAAVATAVAVNVGTKVIGNAIGGGGGGNSGGGGSSGGGSTSTTKAPLSAAQIAMLAKGYSSANTAVDDARGAYGEAGTKLDGMLDGSMDFGNYLSGEIKSIASGGGVRSSRTGSGSGATSAPNGFYGTSPSAGGGSTTSTGQPYVRNTATNVQRGERGVADLPVRGSRDVMGALGQRGERTASTAERGNRDIGAMVGTRGDRTATNVAPTVRGERATLAPRQELASSKGLQGTYVDAALYGDATPEMQANMIKDREKQDAQLARAIAASQREATIKEYDTDGVDQRQAKMFSNYASGIDRANAIAASQGFAQALNGGLADSTQAATRANNLTREFADKYGELTDKSYVQALSENRGNYDSYLSGKGLEVEQNKALASSSNQLYDTMSQQVSRSDQNYANSAADRANRLVSALSAGDKAQNDKIQTDDSALINNKQTDDNFFVNSRDSDTKRMVADDSFFLDSANTLIKNKQADDDFYINSRTADRSDKQVDDDYYLKTADTLVKNKQVDDDFFIKQADTLINNKQVDDNFYINSSKLETDRLKVDDDFALGSERNSIQLTDVNNDYSVGMAKVGVDSMNAATNARDVEYKYDLGLINADNSKLSTLGSMYINTNKTNIDAGTDALKYAGGNLKTASDSLGKITSDIAGSNIGDSASALFNKGVGAVGGLVSDGIKKVVDGIGGMGDFGDGDSDGYPDAAPYDDGPANTDGIDSPEYDFMDDPVDEYGSEVWDW